MRFSIAKPAWLHPRIGVGRLLMVLRLISIVDVLIVVTGVALALAVRYPFLSFKSADFIDYTRVWYNTLKEGGFASFRQNFSNYNVPYLYLLYLVIRLAPDLPAIIATKIPSIAADFAMAWLAYRIVRLRYQDSPIPMFAAFAVLFAPTVVLNGAFWGQADALDTAALVACLYCLLVRREIWAMIMFGVSVAFKAQGVFLLPLLAALALRRQIRWQYFLLLPTIMFAAVIPAWAAGRSLVELLLIYPAQAGQYEQLSMHAPSLLSWIPDLGKNYPYFYPVGVVVAITAALCYCLVVYRSQAKLTPALVVELASVSVLLMPFVLPKMHERYFYPADVITILLAFYRPRLFYVTVAMSVISFFAYQPALLGVEPVPIPLLAFGVLILLVILIRDVMLELYPAPVAFPEEVQSGA